MINVPKKLKQEWFILILIIIKTVSYNNIIFSDK